MGNKGTKYDPKNIDSPLAQAQTLKLTRRSGLAINQNQTPKMLNRKELEKMKKNVALSTDVRIILNPPFSVVDRITDNLYLTGVGGLIEENIMTLKITCIINATYEMPLLKIKGIETYRVPVDDDVGEEILIYFDDVADKIHSVSKSNGRTVVHCMAGASRSSSLILAYLIKYQDYNLKNAFCYLKSLRPCARPNIGFFAQLVVYEKFYRSETSVEIIEIIKEGRSIQVPDFYQSMFPDLFKAEVKKQLHKSHLSKIKLQESNKNYINRNRNYYEMHRDIDNLRKNDDSIL